MATDLEIENTQLMARAKEITVALSPKTGPVPQDEEANKLREEDKKITERLRELADQINAAADAETLRQIGVKERDYSAMSVEELVKVVDALHDKRRAILNEQKKAYAVLLEKNRIENTDARVGGILGKLKPEDRVKLADRIKAGEFDKPDAQVIKPDVVEASGTATKLG